MKILFDLQLTPHFRLSEFSCKCGGKYADCDRTWLHAGLAPSLEFLRAKFYPKGLVIISGYRCVKYNDTVGGVANSQHRFGTAVDLAPRATFNEVYALQLFSGIGVMRTTSNVVHLDIRHLGPENTLGRDKKTKATPHNPAVWSYE